MKDVRGIINVCPRNRCIPAHVQTQLKFALKVMLDIWILPDVD